MRKAVQWGIGLAIVVALAALGQRALVQRKAAQAAAERTVQRVEVPVELSTGDLVRVQPRELVQELAVSGTLKAVNTVLVKARVAGELGGLGLREGDAVRAGQVLARIDPTDTQARLRQAQQQAEAARAQAEIAQRTHDNNRSLVDQGFISRWSLDSSAATLASAQANHQAALAAADVLRKSLDDTVLRAPIDGVVSQRLASNGERVPVDGRVLEIVDLSRLEMEASLSPADSLRVRVGQVARLNVEGSPTPLRARVSRINPSASAGSRAVIAYLALEPAPGLRQGLFVQGALQLGSVRANALPLEVVRTDRPQPYVQVVRDQRVQHQNVTLGERGIADGQPMTAVQGLADDALVLSAATGLLREGTLVKTPAAR